MGFKFFNFKGSLIKKKKPVREPGGIVCIGYRRNADYDDSGPSSSRPNGIINSQETTAVSSPQNAATNQVPSQIPLNWCGTKVPEVDETTASITQPTNGTTAGIKIKQTAPTPEIRSIQETNVTSKELNPQPEPPNFTQPPITARHANAKTHQEPESLEDHITFDDYITMRAKSETSDEPRSQDRSSTLIAMTEKNDDDDFGYDPRGHDDYEDIELRSPARESTESPEPIFARVGKPSPAEPPQKKKVSFDDNQGFSSLASSIFFSGEEPEPELRIRNHALSRFDDDNGSQTSC